MTTRRRSMGEEEKLGGGVRMLDGAGEKMPTSISFSFNFIIHHSSFLTTLNRLFYQF